jgi:hypothetical protein
MILVLACCLAYAPAAEAQGSVTKTTATAGTNAGELDITVTIIPDAGYSVVSNLTTGWAQGGTGVPQNVSLTQVGMTTTWTGTITGLPTSAQCNVVVQVTFQNNGTKKNTAVNGDPATGKAK